MIMLKSIAACSSWWSLVITVKQASEITSACSDILSDALSGKSHQSLQLRFAALSSRAIFMFLWIRLSFIQKTLALHSLFSTLLYEKTCMFLWAVFFIFLFFIRLKFTEHFTLFYIRTFYIRDLETSGKSVKFNLPNYLVCKLSHIVNFDGFWTLMVWHFRQLLSCTADQITWTILTGILIGLL